MKFLNVLSIVLLALLSGLLRGIPALADAPDNSQITPVVTVAPNLFAIGQVSNAFVCVSNGNPSSTKSIQAGDLFRLTFDASIGALSSVATPVLVNSSNLNAADSAAHLGGAPNEIVISYLGTTRAFTPGDSFCVKVAFTTSSLIGSGKIQFHQARAAR